MVLPPRLRLSVVFEATAPQRLSPLPTTSLRGALLRAARGLVCPHDLATLCRDCPTRGGCPYPRLFEPKVALPSGGEGDLPPPVSMRPADGLSTAPIALAPRNRLTVVLTLVGAEAIAARPYVEAALAGAALRGIGWAPPRGEVQARPRLRLEAVRSLAETRLAPAPAYRLQLRTPLLVDVEHSAVRSPDAAVLWRIVVRRVRLLARWYGAGAPEPAFAPPFEVVSSDLTQRTVKSVSVRQGQTRTFSGPVGEVLLKSVRSDDADLAALLAFCADVGLGGKTLLGFGATDAVPSRANARGHRSVVRSF